MSPTSRLTLKLPYFKPYFDFCSADDENRPPWPLPGLPSGFQWGWSVKLWIFFFFKNICTVEHYWCCKLPVQPRREKWTYGAPKDEDNEVFWRCERVINNPNIFVFSDILRADTMPFSRHSLWVYVSVFPPRSGVDNCWQLLQLLQRERLQFNLGSLDGFFFYFLKLNILFVSLLYYGMK